MGAISPTKKPRQSKSDIRYYLSIDNIDKFVNRQRCKCCQLITLFSNFLLSIDNISRVVDWQPCQCCRSTTRVSNSLLSIDKLTTFSMLSIDNPVLKVSVVDRQHFARCRLTIILMLSIDNPLLKWWESPSSFQLTTYPDVIDSSIDKFISVCLFVDRQIQFCINRL